MGQPDRMLAGRDVARHQKLTHRGGVRPGRPHLGIGSKGGPLARRIISLLRFP